jgi:Uma2 family endonuclease
VLSAPVDCILSDSTVVQPDIAYLAADSPTVMSERAIEGPPTLAVEIVSSTDRIDRGRKMRLYVDHGVPYYWVLDGEARVVDAFCLVGGAYAAAGRLEGSAAAALPPFADLQLDPALVWA